MIVLTSRYRRYGLALLFVLLAVVGRMILGPALGGRQPFATFSIAVIAAAWWCGLGPSILALVLGLLAVGGSSEGFGGERSLGLMSDLLRFGVYLTVGTALISFGESKRRALERLERDAREKLRAQEAEIEGRERLRMAVESAEIGTFDLQLPSGNLQWSDRSKAIFGLPPEAEVNLDRFLQMVHVEDRDRISRATQSALDLRGPGLFESDFRCLAVDGKVRSLVAKGRTFFEGSGTDRRAVRFLGTILDLTDQELGKRAIAEFQRLAEYGRDVGVALTRSATLAEMLDRCAVATVTHLHVAFARIWTADDAGEFLELRASAGMYTHVDGPHGRVPIGQFKIGQIARDRMPHLTNTVIGDPKVPAQEWARAEKMVAFAGYPLIVEDRLIGVIAMFSRRELSEATIDRLGSVADEIAIGIKRKQAEDRLHRQSEWLRVTLASVGDAVIATDTQGRVNFLNPVAQELTGWLESEAKGLPLSQVFRIIDEGTRTEVESPAIRAIREGSIVGLANHTILIRRDGSERSIDDSASPIRHTDGSILGAVLIFRDVENRRKTERALEQSEARYRALIEISPQVIWESRADGYLTYANTRWTEFSGLDLAQTVGDGWLSAIPPDQRERILSVWNESVERGTSYEVEIPFVGLDGRERWHLTRGLPIFDRSGRIEKWVGVTLDIHEIKRGEQNLGFLAQAGVILAGSLDEKETLGNIARLAVDGFADLCFFDLALNGDEVERVAWADADPTRSAWDKPTLRFVPARSSATHPASRAITTGQSQFLPEIDDAWMIEVASDSEDLRVLRASGLRSILSVPVPVPGRVLGALTFGLCSAGRTFDESDIRLAEDLGRRAGVSVNNALLFREAREANEAKSQFLAVLSHELRTPLNPILLAATAMLEHPSDPDELRPTLEMIRQNVNLQARLIDDLLDVMRIVRGKMPLHWEVADCHRLIDQAIQICRSEVFGKVIRVDLALAATHRHVNADPARLQQVFWNLIKNAVKFTPGGGSISIRTRDEPEVSSTAGRLVIEVADSGIGIDSKILPWIFDPFQQGETTITRKFGGLGLGLAICKGIVEAHGGSIVVESPGKDRGTTFRITLNALPQPVVEGEKASNERTLKVEKTYPKSLRVLVVEDEPTTLRLMARLLRGLGHDVTTAPNITQGLDTFEAGEFDLIISDIGLPDGSGLELIRDIVARRGVIPAIALTGYGMEEDIRRSREAGFTAHLTKPIDFVKLESMIQQVAPVGR